MIDKIYRKRKDAIVAFNCPSERMMHNGSGYCLVIIPGGYQWQKSAWLLVDGVSTVFRKQYYFDVADIIEVRGS